MRFLVLNFEQPIISSRVKEFGITKTEGYDLHLSKSWFLTEQKLPCLVRSYPCLKSSFTISLPIFQPSISDLTLLLFFMAKAKT